MSSDKDIYSKNESQSKYVFLCKNPAIFLPMNDDKTEKNETEHIVILLRFTMKLTPVILFYCIVNI